MIATLVIVHWNTPKELRISLENLAHNPEFHVVVIDNNSNASLDWIKEDFNVEFIRNTVNRGYAFACNQGIQHAQGEWVFFINPDVKITIESITQIIDYARDHNLDAVSPAQDNSNYKKPLPSPLTLIQEFTPLGKIIPQWFMKDIIDQFTLFGGCLGVRKWIIEDIGGWDERFFVWFEDADLTQRLYKSGYKIGWAPAEFEHSGGASFNAMSTQARKDLFFNELDVYAQKHFDTLGRFITQRIKKMYTKLHILPDLQNGISITVPNMKKELLDEFLRSNSTMLGNLEHLIIVTSAIKSKDIWNYRKHYPDIRFIPITKNKGFAHTTNIGMHVSPTAWVGTINDDVLLSDHWIAPLINAAPNDAGSINPIIYDKNDVVESAGIRIQPKGKAIPIKKIPESEYSLIDSSNAAAVLYKNEALQRTGLFDELFGSYLEDIDLSLRLKRKGYQNYACTNAHIKHLGQSTSTEIGRKKQWLDFKNWILVIYKNWPFVWKVKYFPIIIVERLRNISGIIKS